VVDADALTCFRKKPKELYRFLDKNKVITPHPKEFHSIFPSIKKSLGNKEKLSKAISLAKTNIILKGAVTLIGSFDGKIVYNKHTSSELAVIGSGDVLSGLIASLIGKNKMNPFLAACAAVWIHGDLAKQFGSGLIAEDIIKTIPHTLKKLRKWKT
jgi:NAD(P)H-hydrate epimerase